MLYEFLIALPYPRSCEVLKVHHKASNTDIHSCMRGCIYTHTYLYMDAYTCLHIHSLPMCTFAYIHYHSEYEFTSLKMHVYTHTWVHISIYRYTHIYTWMHIHVCMYIYSLHTY